MTKLHLLGSGSKANTYVIEDNKNLLIVDQGLSYKQFSLRCLALGCDSSQARAIVVTHEHSDHISGVPLTAHKLGIPVYGTEKTLEIIKRKSKYPLTLIPLYKQVSMILERWNVTPFSIHHDAVDPVGFSIELSTGKKVVIATDTGRITAPIMRHLNEASSIVLEANHEPELLYQNKRYPPDLKTRIRSDHGHLSNAQTFDALSRISSDVMENVIFAHLSEENNNPALLQQMADKFFEKRSGVKHFLASQKEPFSVII
ncbi:MBL fold metallo-hydrolase [bacterium]|nr:MBL fold metallo-hydrolase [bacterium]